MHNENPYYTYSTHQVPLLLEERIGEYAVRSGVAVLQSRRRRHASQIPIELAEAGEQRGWLLAVVPFAPDALVLLLHPSNLSIRARVCVCVKA